MTEGELEKMEKEILDGIQTCIRCRMCAKVCPTYEGWFTQSSIGRLSAINLHLKHGLGSEEALSRLLYGARISLYVSLISVGIGVTLGALSFQLDDENLDPKTWCRFPILSGGFERELSELEG